MLDGQRALLRLHYAFALAHAFTMARSASRATAATT
jgi:hypothetical protein